MMKIWIDITNSPQVLFMTPIIAEMQNRGHSLVITTRRYSETVPLADKMKLTHTVIGTHGGRSLFGKGVSTILRALRLMWFLRATSVTLAVSPSSFSQAIAAGIKRIPFMAFNDYEGNPGMHIVCRVAKKILVPSAYSKQNLHHFGASNSQIVSYDGLKENVYLSGFIPDPKFLENAGFPHDKIVVTMRPPSEDAAYHQFENPLFDEVLSYIASHDNIFIVLLPRNSRQRQKYKGLMLRNVHIPLDVLDGPNLIYYSDLVIGGGGTMNREAAVLGTPAYSLFRGRLGSVDQHLIDIEKLIWIRTSSEIHKIILAKKNFLKPTAELLNQNLIGDIVDKIIML